VRIQATSPGKKFDIKERVSVLKLSAENVGEAIDLAWVLKFIEDEGLEKLGEMCIDRPYSEPERLPTRRRSKGGEGA